MTGDRKPTKAEAIRAVAPIFWQIQQRLERERREAEAAEREAS